MGTTSFGRKVNFGGTIRGVKMLTLIKVITRPFLNRISRFFGQVGRTIRLFFRSREHLVRFLRKFFRHFGSYQGVLSLSFGVIHTNRFFSIQFNGGGQFFRGT